MVPANATARAVREASGSRARLVYPGFIFGAPAARRAQPAPLRCAFEPLPRRCHVVHSLVFAAIGGTLMRTLVLAAAAVSLVLPGAALACSVTADYRVPTNLELAGDANAIVLGEVVGQAEAVSAPDEALSSAIAVRPLEMVKGLAPGGTLVIPGTAVASGSAAAPPADAAPDFAEPHPEAHAGACIRRSFPAGARVLFFLRRADGGWVPAGGPFSRWAEDVGGPEDGWVQLARLYAHAAQLPPGERAALIEDQLEALQARIGSEAVDDPVTLAMATDLERSMAAPGYPDLALRDEGPAPAEPAGAGELGDLGERIDALAAGE